MFEKLVIIDARGHLLGRLAATIAKELLLGQRIVVIRCEEINVSGRFLRNKIKFQHYLNKRRNTNPRRGPFHYRAPHMIFWKTIRGMLPHKLPKGKHALARLKVFDGVPPPYHRLHQVVVPGALRVVRMRPGRKYTVLKRISTEFGWKRQGLIENFEKRRQVLSVAYYKRRKALSKLRAKAVTTIANDVKVHTETLKKSGYLV
eukprot:TRINITY_DN1292_c0_g1_i1.p1 TRINITY_DN1292_c0_g1~~TRINITY_DN1292_c0_g1_i1.p1  ORF type:complete len:203 (+),score=30.92 TRINITY_DN1292_c0_g1_i1:67-675(+)